ncbi:MAG TPA: hypothetical protein VEH62_08790 [Gemmatimonadales bacterium]|nr:hypothetical protein [Gemmatimonadales bacterium]
MKHASLVLQRAWKEMRPWIGVRAVVSAVGLTVLLSNVSVPNLLVAYVVVLAAVFAWKVVSGVVRVRAEERAHLTPQQITEARQDDVDALVVLAASGDALLERDVADLGQQEQWTADLSTWYADVRSRLKGRFAPSDVAAFDAPAGALDFGPSGQGFNPQHQQARVMLFRRLKALEAVIGLYRYKPLLVPRPFREG